MPGVINPEQLQSEDTVDLARWLLGKELVRVRRGAAEPHIITEVEAYDSEKDLACHASRGRTARTETLYHGGGIWYVYLVYGMHHLLNLVTGPEGYPAAVLIRSVLRIPGPGRVTRALGIGLGFNGLPAQPASGLYLVDRGMEVPRRLLRSSPRIGVDYAGRYWAGRRWRFFVAPGFEAWAKRG